MLQDGLFFEKYNDKVKCHLCPHNCLIPEGKYCGKILVTRNGYFIKVHMDEKVCPECGYSINIVL